MSFAARSGLAPAALLLLACSGAPPTFHRDVEPVMRARCTPCHDGSGLAPFPLRTLEELRAVRVPVRAAVAARTMPPWGASRDCASYAADWSLTDAQVDTVVRWIDEGTVEGEPVAGPPLPPLSAGLSRVDLELPLPEPYAPASPGSDYRCFVLAWPLAAPTHVTGFRARPSEPTMVHHAIAYAAPPEAVAELRALDEADPGPGYFCAAGPGLIDRRISWVGAWEPGSLGDEYPEGTGFAVTPGSALVVQMHYDGSRGTGADRTTLELKLEAAVQREARVMTWAAPEWITTEAGMLIPAGERDVQHAYFADPTPSWSDGKPLLVRGVSVHLHQLGTSGRISIRHADGSTTCLLDVPRWDFEWQRSYLLQAPRALKPGDRLGIECRWDNSAEHQPVIDGRQEPPRDRSWGPGTRDEMCLGALFVTR